MYFRSEPELSKLVGLLNTLPLGRQQKWLLLFTSLAWKNWTPLSSLSIFFFFTNHNS